MKRINQGKLIEIAYLNQQPIFLQKNRYYSLDKEGKIPATLGKSYQTIATNPSAEWKL